MLLSPHNSLRYVKSLASCRRPGNPRRVSSFPERQGFVIRIEGMKNRQPAFESLHKVAILAAYRHDTAFLVTICTPSEQRTL
jgi:hypothetical protein